MVMYILFHGYKLEILNEEKKYSYSRYPIARMKAILFPNIQVFDCIVAILYVCTVKESYNINV